RAGEAVRRQCRPHLPHRSGGTLVTDKPAIGIVGLGIMGAPVALNLASRGYKVTAWNLERENYDRVKDDGVDWADSPAELWGKCDIALVCVLGDDALEAVVLGDKGF